MSKISTISLSRMAGTIGGLAAWSGHAVNLSRDPGKARSLADQVGFRVDL